MRVRLVPFDQMRVLILGGSGMLGHKAYQTFNGRFETYATIRGQASDYGRFRMFDESRLVERVAAEDFDSIKRAVASTQPDVILNCIGIVKQDKSAKDPLASIRVNSLFPHRVARLAREAGARLIHLSTDCVFSGSRGHYAEDDLPDPPDLYGRSKLLGEVDGEGCLTIRTSMIGRELRGSHGLLEWFLGQQGKKVRGFKRAVFSGFTTNALAEIIADIVSHHPDLRGMWHVAAEAIDKFDLLSQVRDTYELNIEIEPDETFVCDRSLNGERFRKETGIVAPQWPEMIAQMHADKTQYDELRRVNA